MGYRRIPREFFLLQPRWLFRPKIVSPPPPAARPALHLMRASAWFSVDRTSLFSKNQMVRLGSREGKQLLLLAVS